MIQMVVSVERRSWVQSITGELIAKDVTRRKMNEVENQNLCKSEIKDNAENIQQVR